MDLKPHHQPQKNKIGRKEKYVDIGKPENNLILKPSFSQDIHSPLQYPGMQKHHHKENNNQGEIQKLTWQYLLPDKKLYGKQRDSKSAAHGKHGLQQGTEEYFFFRDARLFTKIYSAQ